MLPRTRRLLERRKQGVTLLDASCYALWGSRVAYSNLEDTKWAPKPS